MFMVILSDFQGQSIGVAGMRERMKELFKGHGDLVSGFNAFLPKGYEIAPDEYEAPPKKAVDFEEALDFVHKIEERFQNDGHVYLSFRDILYMFRSGSKDITEVYMEVSSLFRNHPDLLEGFTRFFSNYSTTPVQHAPYGQHLAQCFDEQSSTTIIKQQLQLDKQHSQQDKLITSHDHNLSIHSSKLDDGKTRIEEHKKQVEESRDRRVHDRNKREPDPSNNRGLKSVPENKKSVETAEVLRLTADFPSYDNKDTLKESFGSNGQLFRSSKVEDKYRDQKRKEHVSKEREENHEKCMEISIHELDLNDCELCNVSYRRLPEDYPIAIPNQRSELDAEVLNDHWVSVTSGSEDCSFKHMPRNQYEKKLFQCEDDRFEMDLLIERVRSTAKRTEDLYNSIIGNKINIEGPIRIEERFSVLHLRCIEYVYGEHGLEVTEALRKNPIVALPVIINRLKQKLEEWSKCRLEFNRVWAEVYAKNYNKSLDYRSFYFKQQDSKNFSRKSLVAEIKEIKEKQKQKYLQATAAGNKLSPVPHMQFEYSDVEIHEDLYKLFCHVCKEIVSSKGLSSKMLRVWTTFLEPILGVTSQYTRVSDFSKQFAHNAQGDYDSVAKSQSVNASTMEIQRCDVATPDPLANGVLIQGNNQEEFAGQCQFEKEGEISPSVYGDLEEDIENASEGVEGIKHDDIDDKAEVERMRNARSAADGSLLESSFLSVKPLAKYVSSVLREERIESRVIYGNDDFYVLLRLHHILYERILFAKTNSKNAETKRRIANDANSPDPYSRFINALYNLLGGSVDEAKFEDECQTIFGNQSYMLFKLDKLIHKLVQQLQVVANVEINNKLLQLFEYENSQKPERLTHLVYLANARVILPEENIYRLECSSGPSKLFIWLMDSTSGIPKGFALDPDCADYLYNDFLSVFPVKEEPHGFMLQRNKRKCGASDEFPDMEGIKIMNKLDHVIDCNSSKVRYVAFTEDVFYRPRKKRRTWSKHENARVERFHRFLSNCDGTASR